MRSRNRRYYPRLDMLRGVAAWWVVMHHCFTMLPTGLLSETSWTGTLNPAPMVLTAAWIPLTIFFVVSGYSIGLGIKGVDVKWSGYLAARWLRVAPLYLLVLVVGLVSGSRTMAEIIGVEVNGPVAFLEALTMLPFREATTYFPWMATVWSVRLEVAMYLFAPFIVVVLARFQPPLSVSLVFGGCFGLILLSRLATDLSARDILYTGIPGRLIEFSAGLVLAFYVDGRVSGRWARILGMAGVVLVLPMAFASNRVGGEIAMPGALRPGFYAAALVIALLLLLWATPDAADRPGRIGAVVVKLGTWSYSTYLWHFAVMTLVALPVSVAVARALDLTPGPRTAIGVVVTVLVTIPVSYLSFRWIESPFLRLRPRYVRPDSRTGVEAVR